MYIVEGRMFQSSTHYFMRNWCFYESDLPPALVPVDNVSFLSFLANNQGIEAYETHLIAQRVKRLQHQATLLGMKLEPIPAN